MDGLLVGIAKRHTSTNQSLVRYSRVKNAGHWSPQTWVVLSLVFTNTDLIPQQSTNNAATSQAQADADLTRALEMSLEQQYSMEVDSFREIETTENVRTGSKPVALRARELNHVFAAVLLQALYHVPQVRNVVRLYKPDASNYWLSDSTCDRIGH